MPMREQMPELDMMSSLVALANLARAQLGQPDGIETARQAVAERIGHDHMVIIPAVELCEIKFKAQADDRPSVGDVNSHNDRWVGDDGDELGTICGEGWKISRLDDDVVSYYRETAETKFGRIETAGIWNSSAIWQGRWQSLFATGVSGEVAGMFGVRQLYQEVPRLRYRSFVLLIPINAADAALQQRIRRGYVAD
ncbi:hypothetical protein BTI_5244 [Burkholderia thailandensis MSMB121]|nr:hypothetical protein BTI_5244 [Burkholderia thailandensis MSMB121]AJY38663.1 hypothetical protein BW21_4866 [Burkholderia sp. 2002721687]ALX46361.1 hypothetical protein AQ610_28810 [Burkholderia humptydooensis]ATF33300.1 hypothetical protein CO709_08185 [Burkholderia thailandensis]KST71385.1 hypothetical protein WS76_22760 [Burkholderia humptydooensis]